MTALAETRRELVDRFQGVTAYVRSPAKGLWTAPDGHTEADDGMMVEVVTETLPWPNALRETHVRALPVEMPDEGEA